MSTSRTVNKSPITSPKQQTCAGVVAAYLYVISSPRPGEGLFRACIMYGVFAATACFHNLYTLVKNVVTLDKVSSDLIMMMIMMMMMQATDLLMNTVSLYGMLVSNLVNWSWQAGYLATLTVQVIIQTLTLSNNLTSFIS